MGSTLRIAWRNLWRNRRRTVLALAAIALSQALVLFYGGILRGYSGWTVEAITGPMLGHIQVHAAGWRRQRSMDAALAHLGRTLAALRRAPGVADAHARLYAPALAAAGEKGYGVVVLGVEPAAESGPAGLLRVTPALPAERHVLVGRPLATRMGLAAGDTIAIVGSGADGSLANDLFVVAGLIDTPVDLVNQMGVVMELGEAQGLFAMPDGAHEIVVHARQPDEARALAERLARLPELAGAEVLDWKRLEPALVALVRLIDQVWLFMLALVFIAAASGIANTMLMATYERIHELGMLLALGAAPRRIVAMVVAESLALGLTGALAGSVLGASIVAATRSTGIDLAAISRGAPRELSFAGLSVSMRIYPSLALDHLVQGVLAVLVTSIVASAWPAWRAARLEPQQALRA